MNIKKELDRAVSILTTMQVGDKEITAGQMRSAIQKVAIQVAIERQAGRAQLLPFLIAYSKTVDMDKVIAVKTRAQKKKKAK